MRVTGKIKKCCTSALLPGMLAMCCGGASAQYNTAQNMNWAFGVHCGISFNTGAPVSGTTGLWSPEGTACISDNAGNLLFYTNGNTVWDRTHDTMMDGASICPYPTESSTQSSLIVPVMNYTGGTNPGQYYIFSIPHTALSGGAFDTTGSGLYYSIVDMGLNGGNGAIVPGTAGTRLAAEIGEKLIAVPGINCDMWVLTHRRDSPIFYAFNVTACGINPVPVVSYAGEMAGPIAYGFGAMKISPGYNKLAVFNMFTCPTYESWPVSIDTLTGAELFDFDAATGIVSGGTRLSKGPQEWSGEFSPDGTKLYTSCKVGVKAYLIQYDLSAPPPITATRYVVDSFTGTQQDPKLAPDGKIYMRQGTANFYLSRIAAPNLAGAACNHEEGIVGPMAGPAFLALPNVAYVPLHTPTDTAYTASDTTVCFSTAGSVVLTAPYPACRRWYDGSAPLTNTITGPGSYSVSSVAGCLAYKHVFRVHAATEPCDETGIEPVQADAGISIYPNPAVNECVLQCPQPLPNGTIVRIYDPTGRLMYEGLAAPAGGAISLEGFSVGVYSVRIGLPGALVVKKLVIAR